MDENRLLGILRSTPLRTYSLDELMRKVEAPPKKEKAVKRALRKLVREGRVERTQGRRFGVSRSGHAVEGRVEFDRKLGAVLALPDDSRVPILENDQAGVEHGDLVRVELVALGKKGRIFARVIEVLERPAKRRVGVFRSVARARFVEVDVVPGYLTRTKADRRRAVTDVIIAGKDDLGADDGQLVEVELFFERSTKGASPLGRVVGVLGKPGERATEVKRLFIEHALEAHFPEEVEEETLAFGVEPTESDAALRRDVRAIPLVTIDSETAKDFDDAVYAVREDAGHVRLLVGIADVSHYVRPGTALDREAFRRGTSTYLTDRAIPMLPEVLSNGLCSLKPHVDRLCMLADIVLDSDARVVSSSFVPAIMRSRARLTYTRVARALEGHPDEECREVLPSLLLMSQVAHRLLERRLRRGAIDLDLPEPEVIFDTEGNPTHVARRPRNDAHRLIEELMLVTNEAAADFFLDKRLPSVFRIHEDPDPLKLELFAGLCQELGFEARLGKKPRPIEVARILDQLAEHPLGTALHRYLLRSLTQARYDAECKGHYGLASESYLHFTSPIRRYPDLMVHRLMKSTIEEPASTYSRTRLSEISLACSVAERHAMLAERECTDLDRSFVALRHLGETCDARITGVQGFGLFASIDDPFIEGLIPVQTLPDDFYEVDDYGAMLTGRDSGRRFMLGDTLRVEVASSNIGRRQVEFRLADGGTDKSGPEVNRREKRDALRSTGRSRTKDANSTKRDTRSRRGKRETASSRADTTKRSGPPVKEPRTPRSRAKRPR